MKILFIAPRFHTNQLGLVKKLVEEKHEVDFFVIGKGISENYKHISPRVIPVSRLTKWYVKNFHKKLGFPDYAKIVIPKVFEYWKMIYSFKPDVMVLRGGSVMVYSWFAIPLALLLRIKIVFYTQGPKFVDKISAMRRFHDLVFVDILKVRWYTPVLYRGKSISGKIELRYIEYVPFFVYPQVKDLRYQGIRKSVNFLCVAKFEKRKNITLLIEVFAGLKSRYSNFNLSIIGSTGNEHREANYSELQRLVSRHKLDRELFLFKNIPHEQMGAFFLQHQVLILPSIKESASVSQIEAMSYGLAVICSYDNGTAHYIQDNVNGFLIDANHAELAAAVCAYLDNPEVTLLHGRKSITLINGALSVDEAYSRLMKVFLN